MRLLVLGSSVGLNVRPPRDNQSSGNYAELLARRFRASGLDVVNQARWNDMITGRDETEFSNLILQTAPQYVVFNYGINECVPRLLPHGLWRLLNSHRAKRSRLAILLNRVIARATPKLIGWFRLTGWMSPPAFGKELSARIAIVQKEARATVFLLTICPASSRVEAMLPGANHLIREFNGIIRDVAAKFGTTLIDAHELICGGDSDALLPDGIHFSMEGHQQVAGLISNHLAAELGPPSMDDTDRRR